MFTGIVEAVQEIRKAAPGGLEVSLPAGWTLAAGESVAVNGVCLTAVSFRPGAAFFDVSPETFRRTALGGLRAGAAVNLERAMPADGRFGGHFVTGHVDGTARLLSVRTEGNSRIVEAEKAAGAAMVEKGSVALDGVSLTVYAVREGRFSVSVIPHTWESTALRALKPGALMNIEYDILGKYAAAGRRGVTMELLRENGFI